LIIFDEFFFDRVPQPQPYLFLNNRAFLYGRI
jgi:hypothetical protein